ncbi:hypothetical protein ALI22I_20495 [Saccharothrix sp. ALI-22-I]|uniref:hypothetical protein n=1 Tax=Saccharothrix sp. ALI-22-I TaxID=1933778 RepID=UPI00097C1A83|nr:hypothetical protein [Saccharothrix sp. ALI-22-I]ONI88120.1 hypothetical protein ALI22I_20495 [Saccharothrix sp. ALI-22-I]
MFTFYHRLADLYFEWDGWMQVTVRAGEFAPHEAFPDRFDIREPDLRDPARHPLLPGDGSVHLVPETQEAFEQLCDTWWRGGELCVGVRDYTADPWQVMSYGITQGKFRYRFTGGSHIEVAPAEVEVWRPVIDLEADGRTPTTLSTVWLMGRTDGWETAWLEAHGIVDRGRGLSEARTLWTMDRLPAGNSTESIAARFGAWLRTQAVQDLAGDAWTRWRDLGQRARWVTRDWPWSTTRQDARGVRWNFWWCGHPVAYVYSPDLRLTPEEARFVLRPDEQAAGGSVTRWLEDRADAWVAQRDR